MESSTAERTAPPGTGTDPRGGFEVYPQMRDRSEAEAAAGISSEQVPTGEFGWRYRSANGQITAVGGEGFATRHGAEEAVRHFSGDVVKNHANLTVKHVEE